MDKLVKIILFIIVLSVIFLFVSKSFSSCNSNTDEGADLAMDAGQEIPKEELFEADEIDYTTTNEDDEAIPEEIVEDDDKEGSNQTIDFTVPPKKEEVRAPAAKNVSTGTGNYMIIAGNYLLKSNAELMITKLKKLGYPNASIGVFDNSKYHTVIAGRYSSYEAASDDANSIKRKGVDCYVKKRS